MNLTRILFLISFMLIFSSFIFASTNCSNMSPIECDVCAYDGVTSIPNINLVKSGCVNNNCDFNLVNTDAILFLEDKSLIFKTNNKCGSNNINVNIKTNLSFKLNSPVTDNTLYIKNGNSQTKVNSLTLIGKYIKFKSTVNANKTVSVFDISDINVVRLTREAYIDLNEETKVKCGTSNDYGIYGGLQLKFNNIEILKDSNSFIQVHSAKTYAGVNNNSYCLYLTRGYPANLVGQSIVNNSNDFNIFVIGGDSADGFSPTGQGDASGGTVIGGGSTTINLNYFENNGITNLEIISGFGGNGGKGQESPNNTDPPGDGGWGGSGGDLFYRINELKNSIDGNLSINLITGNGGNGGNTGFDHGGTAVTTNYAAAGSGRNGGNIYYGLLNQWPLITYDKLNLIYNNGEFSLNGVAGNGGDGGEKVGHGCGADATKGKDGDGGNGGNIFDLNVNFIYNNSMDMNLTLINGNKGIKKGCIGDIPPVDGIDGNTHKIIVDYFDNKAEDSVSITSLNSEKSIISNDFIIKYLRPNSYLPNSLKLLRRGNIELSNVTVNGCFIKDKQTSNQYDFFTKNLKLNLLNMSADVVNSINYYGIYDSTFGEPIDVTCNYCDLNESFSKIKGSYSIYSSIDGNIFAQDLNIYYADANGNKLGLINPIFSGYPLYTNQIKIKGALDPKVGLYKYEIIPQNLVWYDNPEYKAKTLEKTSTPYCIGQQYYIEGRINGTTPFGFPFTPVFKQWG